MKDIELYQGDCLEVMDRLIEDGVKVDLTVTSPPYDNLRTYKGSLEWNEDIWRAVIERLYDITEDGGIVVWVVNDATIKGSESGTSFKQALYFKECGFNIHDTMIWEKPTFTATGALKTRYGQVFEYMFVFTKGKIKTFNPIKDRETKGMFKKNSNIRNADGSVRKKSNIGKVYDSKYAQRFNVWRMNTELSNKNRFHPAQFPEPLARDHILSWSNEGDIVFDPFMGSGTTGKMSILNNRKFIGIEKVEKYFNIAKERINKAEQDQKEKLF